jgi:hypothetical protein
LNAHTRRIVVLLALAGLILVPLLASVGGALR